MPSTSYAAGCSDKKIGIVRLVAPDQPIDYVCIPCPERPTSLTRLWCCSFAAYSPDKDSDIRASARVLDLLGSGIGKGAVGVTYRRDLDTVQVRDGSIFGQRCKFPEGFPR